MNSFASTPQPPVRRVAIVDDSRTIRALLRATLDADPRLTVVGEAGDPYEARNMIKACNPDVITLDVEMPRMNGLVFLAHLMRLRPMPVVMVSNRTREHSEDAIRALSIGAVDCVDVARLQADAGQKERLAEALFHAAGATVRAPAMSAPVCPPQNTSSAFGWNGRFVMIGSSTGGVDALERVFAGFPANCPPTIVAQHMPAAFLRSFVARLDTQIAPDVVLAEDGAQVVQGRILFAPGGDKHTILAPNSADRLALAPATGSELYVPSIDTLFASAVPVAPHCIGVILTGMGRDGAESLKALRDAGAGTVVQSAESCVIDGMPRAARDCGAAEEIADLDSIGGLLLRRCAKREAR